ncbi:alpha-D-ribose 1-methylphosphonate 5-phosphate C-P-lyase PhnJ, partial [Halarcobacter ebronensis]
VNDRYAMDPSPIPKYDTPKLNDCKALQIFGAGREKKIYAIPPYTHVEPLKFEDREFKVENFEGKACARCGSTHSFLDEVYDDEGKATYYCNDTDYCDTQKEKQGIN